MIFDKAEAKQRESQVGVEKEAVYQELEKEKKLLSEATEAVKTRSRMVSVLGGRFTNKEGHVQDPVHNLHSHR